MTGTGTERDLDQAAQRLDRWRAATSTSAGGETAPSALEAVRRFLDDDLNAADAVAVLDEEAAAGRAVGTGAALLGVEL